MSEHAKLALGAYVLGALEPAERADLEAHLTGCGFCRDELALIAGLPGLLGRLEPDHLLAGPASTGRSDSLVLDRAVAELGRNRRRQQTQARLVAVAAAVLLLLTGAATGSLLAGPHDQAPTSVLTASSSQTGASVVFSLHAQPWGTAVTVRLRHVPVGTHCQLVATDQKGHQQTIGSWRADYDGTANITATTDLPPGQLRSLSITSNGTELVGRPIT